MTEKASSQRELGDQLICKICKVQDVRTARFCSWVGASIVGLHAIEGLPNERAVLLRNITQAMRAEGGAETAVLTKITDLEEVLRIVYEVAPTHLQVHARWEPEQLGQLRSRLANLQSQPVQIIAVVGLSDGNWAAYLEAIRQHVDLVLFDHWEGGTGLLLDVEVMRSAISAAAPLRALVAGGLRPENVAKLVQELRPAGVDVQSGVSIKGKGGTKDFLRVGRFMQAARGLSQSGGLGIRVPSKTPLVSMSLTDVPIAELDEVVASLENVADLFHLDHSVSHHAGSFQSDQTASAERLFVVSPSSIYDVHAFAPLEDLSDIAKTYLGANDMLRVVFLHWDLEKQGAPNEILLTQLAVTLRELGVTLGLALQATANCSAQLKETLELMSIAGIKELSIVGPRDDNQYKVRVGAVLEAVRSSSMPIPFGIGIDRQVTVGKAEYAAKLGATRAVIGATALRGDWGAAAETISKVRAALATGSGDS